MTKKARLLVSGCLIMLIALSAHAQSNINFKLNTGAIYLPFTASEYAWTPSENLSFQPGGMLSYEFFISDKKLSNRICLLYVYSNPASTLFVSTGLHYAIYNRWKTAINMSAGLGLGYSFGAAEYDDLSIPFPVIGLEYNRSLTEFMDFSISIGHFYPYSISLQVGGRYWISKKIRQHKGCLSCPD